MKEYIFQNKATHHGEVPVHDCRAVRRPHDGVPLLVPRPLPVDVPAAQAGDAGHQEDDHGANLEKPNKI